MIATLEGSTSPSRSAIETGEDPAPLMIRLSALEAERRLVEGRMQLTRAAVVTLHPHAAARYRRRVAEIQDALSEGDAAGAEAVALVRELIGEIRVLPQGKGEPVMLEIVEDLAALLAQEPTANAVTASVVAGARNSQCSHGRIPVLFELTA